jgi:hypothetical protein
LAVCQRVQNRIPRKATFAAACQCVLLKSLHTDA